MTKIFVENLFSAIPINLLIIQTEGNLKEETKKLYKFVIFQLILMIT
jgi:hypothetical protein